MAFLVPEDLQRLRDLIGKHPRGFRELWAGAAEDLDGAAYRALDRAYERVVEAAVACWGTPVFSGDARAVPDSLPQMRGLRHGCSATIWNGTDGVASVLLDTHDADTLRSIVVEFSRSA